jgi:biopolymer transport protein ExbD
VLLIIFMTISPTKPSRYESRLPERPKGEERTPPETLVVSVSASRGYRLNHLELRSLEELNSELHHALDGRPSDGKTVFIKAAPALPYSDVVSVIDVVKASGGAPIGLQLEALN